MGGVCCKDGVESDREHSRQPQASVEHAQAPTPALPSAALRDAEQQKIPSGSKEPEQGLPVEDIPADGNIKPVVKREKSIVSKSAAAASATLCPIDEAQVVIDDSTGAGVRTHLGTFVPAATSSGLDGTTVSTTSRTSAPPLSANSEASTIPEVAQVALVTDVPAAAPVKITTIEAKPVSPGESTPFNNPPLLEIQQPRTGEVNSSSGPRNLSTIDLATDMRIKVDTTRRSTQPTMSQPVGDGSSSVSYSHSAASSQQPGFSVVPAGSSAGQGPLFPMMGSSAAHAEMIPGEGSAAAGQASAADTAVGSTPADAENTEGSSTMGNDSMAGSSNTSKPATAGFMFGAPRMKERKKERRSTTKSHSSGSNMSGNAPPTGSDTVTVTDSKASGSGAAAPAGPESMAGVPCGSSAECTVEHSTSHVTAAGSSYNPGPTNKAGMFGAGAGGGSLGVVGSTGSSRTSSAITDHKTIGRRIKASAMKGFTDGSSIRAMSRGTARGGSTADSGTDSAGGASLATGGGSGLMDEALPAVVPEEEPEEEEEVEVPEAEPEGEGVEAERSHSSERSSSEHLSIMSPPEGSDVENVLQLICNIFQLPVALVAAYRSANIFIRSTALKLTDDDQWRYSLAQWSMLNSYDLRDVLLVPNASLDERFREYYCVRKEPKVCFFMASPLRSSTGELVGTLCMADVRERMLQPADLLVVNNLQTLVIRQLERDMSLAEERIANEAATEKLQLEMMRALDHFEKCIMFVDTSKPGWEVLYTNMAWEHVTGIPREHVFGGQLPLGPNGVPRVHVMGRPLQDFFMALGGAALDWSSTAADVENRAEFTVNRVAVRQKPDKLVSLHMRLATTEASGELDGMLPKGLPAWVKARGSEAHNYFVFVEEVNPQTGGSSTVYEALAKHVEKVPGLELSHLLGKGGFGSVYYGTWNGMPVAVKMIDNRLTKTNTEGVSLEALMGQELSHPNIVKTIKYVMRSARGASSISGSNSRGVGSNARALPPHSRNHDTVLLGGVGVGAIGAPGSSGRGAPGPAGMSSPGGRAPGMGSYMTSAQPGLSGMTSAQMAAAIDLTSASAMQPPHAAHHHAHHLVHHRTTGGAGTNTTGTTSDATTVAGGGSHYSGGGLPAQVSNDHGPSIRAMGSTPNTPHRVSRSGRETSSGHTVVGPASIAPSSASTAAGPPSHASFSGQPANLTFLPGRTGSSTGPCGHLPGASGSIGHRLAVAGSGGVAPVALPPQLHPLAAPASAPAAASSITAPFPPGAPAPALSSLTPEQQQAAMTSRFSLAFSTITSGGEVLVPDKGRSPSSSSVGGHTAPAHMCSTGSGEDMGEVWIIMEFCDRGSLQDALDRGALKLRKPGGELGETHLPMMIATACEVASALNYLHARGIVHGDLTAWNVMLCTAPEGDVPKDRSGRNFVAKVADFGLSRTLDVRSKIKTRTYGTISHMPPECLINGIISKATDVFAFGVLLWQMYTGLRPWAGMNHGQIIYNVGMKNVQLLFPPGTPPAIADLSSSCTRTDPTQRPGFVEIVNKLDAIRASLGL